MRSIVFAILICFVSVITSCRDDFDFEPNDGQSLEFSRDTVYLDTVFTNISSSTYQLKVYNRSDKNISVSSIVLGRGQDSKYRMMVDGMTGTNGKFFENVEILAKDSLFIFIETTADVASANPTDFLYTDHIQFGNGTSAQKVELVTLIQDAHFLYPRRFEDGSYEHILLGEDPIYGFVLDENDPINGNEYVFTNEKPYVIYGYAAVAAGKTLEIQAGARVHFHSQSGIIVADGGRVEVLGQPSVDAVALENEVIMQGDRLEPMYENVAGQWGAFWFTPGASGHIQHATIKNGMIGLYIQHNAGEFVIKNSKFLDHSHFGIYGQTATINGENIVINYAGQAGLACTLGGAYDFKHTTVYTNYPGSGTVSLWLNNYLELADGTIHSYDLTQANFTNCIFYGANPVSVSFDKKGDGSFSKSWNKNLVRFQTGSQTLMNHPEYQVLLDTDLTIRNYNPLFWNVDNNQLNIKADSPAAGFGVTTSVAADINGIPWGSSVDLGAYKAQDPQN